MAQRANAKPGSASTQCTTPSGGSRPAGRMEASSCKTTLAIATWHAPARLNVEVMRALEFLTVAKTAQWRSSHVIVARLGGSPLKKPLRNSVHELFSPHSVITLEKCPTAASGSAIARLTLLIAARGTSGDGV